MEKEVRSGGGVWGAPNCNTPPQIRGGRTAMAVTRLGIHDNVISPRFPSPIFCSKAFRFQHKRCSLAGSIDENCHIFDPSKVRNDFDLE
jgi:hypothetical protein